MSTPSSLPAFDRDFLKSESSLSCIGGGAIGGKAQGLLLARDVLSAELGAQEKAEIEVRIPRLGVIATDMFDAFMSRNDLFAVADSDLPDDRMAHAFQQADLPAEMLGDLRALTDVVHTPLAVRSSSLLEDALHQPFAGVYETKMTPNNQPDGTTRFQRLVEAVKFVYASTYFKAAKDYRRGTRGSGGDEKMAVVIQEVLGQRHDVRFYPELSGVGRSFNFYPVGKAQREDGVVLLALGLGKTVVDGGVTYAYSPARPKAPPPFASPRDVVANTQKTFWAVNMGKPPTHDPIAEAEYLVSADLVAAEYDDTLRQLASTYLAESDRLVPGVGLDGPRVLDFAPLLVLESYPVNRVLRSLLGAFREAVGHEVEIEFAMTFPRDRGAVPQLGFLQVRPMVVSDQIVDLDPAELDSPAVLLASDQVMGNGIVDDIRDVVYVKPQTFETRHTKAIVSQIDKLNTELLAEDRPYLLIGFGRWGSADPWLGIPVKWGQICGARAIVEATRPELWVDASQGSHFFHNITSVQVSYFAVSHEARPGIDWKWLDERPAAAETEHLRLVRTEDPLLVKVDGRTGRGGVWHGDAGS
jgi:hypothetical protein